MRLFENFRRRIRDFENRRGAGELNLTFPDGSKQSFHFSCKNDRLKVLIAGFSIANGHPEDAPSPRARAIAEAIGRAVTAKPDDRLWGTIHSIVVNKPENKRDVSRDAL